MTRLWPVRRRDLVAQLDERIRQASPAGDLVDELRVCTDRQDLDWALEVWAEANQPSVLVVEPVA